MTERFIHKTFMLRRFKYKVIERLELNGYTYFKIQNMRLKTNITVTQQTLRGYLKNEANRKQDPDWENIVI